MKMRFIIVIGAVLTLGLSGCIRDQWITDDVAVDEFSRFLQKTHGGLATEIGQKNSFLSSNGFDLPCNETEVTARIFQYSGEQRSANFTYNWIIVQTCPTNNMNEIAWKSTISGTYSIPSCSGTLESERNWVITNLDPAEENWILNGNATATGTQESKVRKRQTFESELTASFIAVEIDKATGKMVEGIIDAKLIIAGKAGKKRVYDAQITIDKNSIATINLNGNKHHKILSN